MATRSGRTYVRPSPISRPVPPPAFTVRPVVSRAAVAAAAPAAAVQGGGSLFTNQNGLDEIKVAFMESTYYRQNTNLGIITKEDLIREEKTAEAVFRRYENQIPSICLGKKNPVTGKYPITTVREDYTIQSFEAMLDADYMDFLGIRDNSTGMILSFIIAHLGECQHFPNYWSVNLICAAGLAGSGQFILASMLLAAKNDYMTRRIRNPKVVLELAAKFNNVAGFISYSRLGFKRDASLFYEETGDKCDYWQTRTCFCEKTTMPMSCDLDNITLTQLSLALRRQPIDLSDDTTIISGASNVKQKMDGIASMATPAKMGLVDPAFGAIKAKQASCSDKANNIFSEEISKEKLKRDGIFSGRQITAANARIQKALDDTKECVSQLVTLAQSEYDKFSGSRRRRSSRRSSSRRRRSSRRSSSRRSYHGHRENRSSYYGI